jgi:superfamily II DNA or RNA helicase
MELGSMFRVRRGELSSPVIEHAKRQLTLHQKGGEKYGFGPGGTAHLFKEVADWIEVPRQYAFTEMTVAAFTDKTVEGTPVRFNFTKPLRDVQGPMVADFLSKIGNDKAKYGGIFSAPCGTGKTVMSLKFLAELGRSAIVLVHTGFLMKQWREAISNFTDIAPEEVGTVQQDKCEWQGKKIVLAMVESLTSREYDLEMYKSFGIVVADEVHRHGALTWGQAINLFPARLRIGLSATPRRGDGLWNVVKWNIGEVLTRGEGGGNAKVVMLPTGVEVPSFAYRFGGNEVNLGRLLKIITGVEARNQYIADEMVKAVKSGRRLLVLSDRIAHIDDLEARFKKGWAGAEGVKIGRYVGGIKDKVIEENRTCNLLFGTMQYAKEGLDDPGMDTLFLVTPKGDVEQACGRILRELEGKKQPLVVDFVDEKTGPCIGFAKSRKRQYKTLGFDVTDHALSS